ncbi:Integrator complex subunit 9 [Allomyces arbusculus]|nr:Integrator complex subunit 9 [Allomyces arbusculus]
MDVQLTPHGSIVLNWPPGLSILFDNEPLHTTSSSSSASAPADAGVCDLRHALANTKATTATATAVPDFDTLDYILLSNYVSAARFATAYSDRTLAKWTKVLATRATMDLAKKCLLEQVHQDTTHSQRGTLPVDGAPHRTLQFLSRLTSQTQFVTSGEIIKLASDLTMDAVSSSLTLGAVNWTVTRGNKSVSLLGVSSWEFDRYPEQLHTESLAFKDALAITSVSNSPTSDFSKQRDYFSAMLHQHAADKQCILIPISLSSYSFFDTVQIAQGIHEQHPATTIVCVSPVIRDVVAYGNTMAEHLSRTCQQRALDTLPPLVLGVALRMLPGITHPDLTATIRNLDQPCIILCAPGELDPARPGEFAALVAAVRTVRPAVVLLTDPLAQASVGAGDGTSWWNTGPVVACPLDPRINAMQLGKLVAELKPQRLLTPPLADEYAWVTNIREMAEVKHVVLEPGAAPAHVDLDRDFFRVDVTAELRHVIENTPVMALGPDGTTFKHVTVAWDLDANELHPVDVAAAAMGAATLGDTSALQFPCEVTLDALLDQLHMREKPWIGSIRWTRDTHPNTGRPVLNLLDPQWRISVDAATNDVDLEYYGPADLYAISEEIVFREIDLALMALSASALEIQEKWQKQANQDEEAVARDLMAVDEKAGDVKDEADEGAGEDEGVDGAEDRMDVEEVVKSEDQTVVQ